MLHQHDFISGNSFNDATAVISPACLPTGPKVVLLWFKLSALPLRSACLVFFVLDITRVNKNTARLQPRGSILPARAGAARSLQFFLKEKRLKREAKFAWPGLSRSALLAGIFPWFRPLGGHFQDTNTPSARSQEIIIQRGQWASLTSSRLSRAVVAQPFWQEQFPQCSCR